jgi:ABC-type protease/lipase transport system fused ATPase/permease subunit
VRAHTKANLLWGVVAALAFLVLAQGYNLIGSEQISTGVMIVVALLVGSIASALSHLAEAW